MCRVSSSTVSLFLFKKQHGELRSRTKALHVALNTPVVDVFTEFWVAGLIAVLLVKSWLNSSEDMQTRILYKYVIDIQALQNILVLLDVGQHSRSRGHVVRVVEARLIERPAVKMSRVFYQIYRRWTRLVVIGHVRVVLLEVDGKENLPVVNRIHAAAIQKFSVDVCVDVSQEEQRVHWVFFGDDVHEFNLRRYFRFDAYPGDFHCGVLSLVNIDLIFHIRKYIIVINMLSLLRVVNEQKRQDCIFARLKGVGGKNLQEMADIGPVFSSKRYNDVNSCSFCDIGHGNDLNQA